MNDEQMTQDTQTPQQPQWQWVEDDDFPAYVLQAPDGYRWRITKEFGHPDELLRRINAQQERIEVLIDLTDSWMEVHNLAVNRAERIVTLEAALREAQMHIRADCPACKAGYPRIVTEGRHGSKFTTHPMTYEQTLALEEHLTYFLDTGYVFCSAGWAQWEKDFLTKLNALISPSEAKAMTHREADKYGDGFGN